MDQPFSTALAFASDISRRRNRLGCFRRGQFAALCSARPFSRRRSNLREHFRLPDARFDLDDGLLAGGTVDTRSFRVQHGTGTKETMEGFNAFYFSFITLSTVG